MDNLQSLKRARNNWKYTSYICLTIFTATTLYFLLVERGILPSFPIFLVIALFSDIVLLIAIIKLSYYEDKLEDALEDAEIMASIE